MLLNSLQIISIFSEILLYSHLESLVETNYFLNKSAKEAYRSYILAYNSHSMKDIFNVHRLDFKAIAASFCFSNPPKVELHIDSNASKFRKKMRKVRVAAAVLFSCCHRSSSEPFH